MSGQQNTDRIMTTHVGSLPRPHDLLDVMKARLEGRESRRGGLSGARSGRGDGVRAQTG